MTLLQIPTPRWSLPLEKRARFKGAKGGRGSGKSHRFAEKAVINHIRDPHHKTVCLREVQKDLQHSAKALIETKVRSMNVQHLFRSVDGEIRSTSGRGLILFQGMQDHTADSVKSLEGFHTAWFEEAQNASKRSLKLLVPTIREEDSELWFSWNPNEPTDPIEALFRKNKGRAVLVHVNYVDNPFCPQVIKDDAEADKRADIEEYNHIWLGEYAKHSQSRVFKEYTVKELAVPANIIWFYGIDWGFSQDPTAGLRFCILPGKSNRKTLYIDHEVYEVGVEMERLPSLISQIPGSTKYPVIADNARPESIDYCRRHGIKRIQACRKGKGSIEHGINFLKSFDIVVHPRCVNTQNELKKYSYKVDPKTEEVLSVVLDQNNHLMDGLRYGAEGLHRKGTVLDNIDQLTSYSRGADYLLNDDDEEEESWKVA